MYLVASIFGSMRRNLGELLAGCESEIETQMTMEFRCELADTDGCCVNSRVCQHSTYHTHL